MERKNPIRMSEGTDIFQFFIDRLLRLGYTKYIIQNTKM